MSRPTLVALLALLIPACTVGPDYERPPTPPAEAFQEQEILDSTKQRAIKTIHLQQLFDHLEITCLFPIAYNGLGQFLGNKWHVFHKLFNFGRIDIHGLTHQRCFLFRHSHWSK